MRQETGSNPKSSKRVVSIRITSSGDNFSEHTPITAHDVVILLETAKTMLVPTTILEERSFEEYLHLGGISMDSSTHRAVNLGQSGAMTAIAALPIGLIERIGSTYGDSVTLTSPLLAQSPARGSALRVHLSPEATLLTLNLFNGAELLFAEMFEVKTNEDILYWIALLGEAYDLNVYTIYIDGMWVENVERLIRRYYKKVVLCE